MNAVPMIAECGTHQLDTIPEPTVDERDAAGLVRWSSRRDWSPPTDQPEVTTWCDRCGCDHGTVSLIVVP